MALGVIDQVRCGGDKAVLGFTQIFDGVELSSLAVTPDEFAAAREDLRPQHITALERAIANVQRFHEAQTPHPLAINTEPGVRCELITTVTSLITAVP